MLDRSALSKTTGGRTSTGHQTKPDEDKLYRYGRSYMINAGLVCDIIQQYPGYVTLNKIMQHLEPYATRYHAATNHASDEMMLDFHTSDHTTGGILITYNDSQD